MKSLRPWASSLYITPVGMNEYLVIDSGGYLYEQPSCINCSMAGCLPERSRPSLELVSPPQVTHLPPVWDL